MFERRNNAFTTPHETVAWALSDKEAQKYLETIPYKTGNAWTGFVDAVRKLLGMPSRAGTALSEVLRVSDALLGDHVPEMRELGVIGGINPITSHMVDKVQREAEKSPEGFARGVDTLLPAAIGNALRKTWGVLAKEVMPWQSKMSIESGILRAGESLAPIRAPVEAIRAADLETSRVATKTSDRMGVFADELKAYLLGIKDVNIRDKVSANMMRLGGESSIMGVHLKDSWDDNVLRDPSLKGMPRGYFDRLRGDYMRAQHEHPEMIALLEKGADLNKQMSGDSIATMARDIIRGTPTKELQQHLDALDFFKNPGKMEGPLRRLFADAEKLPNPGAKAREVFTEDQAARQLGLDSFREQIMELKRLYTSQTDAPYFHLGRDGDYYVRGWVDAAKYTPAMHEALVKAMAPYGKIVGDIAAVKEQGFRFHLDSMDRMNGLHKAVMEAVGGGLAKTDGGLPNLAKGLRADEPLTSAAGLTQAMRAIHETLLAQVDPLGLTQEQATAMRQAITRQFLAMLPETSSRKAAMQRQGTAGYDGDFSKIFSRRMSGMVHDLAHAYTAHQFTDAFRGFHLAIKGEGGLDFTSTDGSNLRAQEIYNELALRHVQGMTPAKADWISALTSFGHTFFLAFSTAFLLRTAAQPFHRGSPIIMARYGKASGLAALAGAYYDIGRVMIHTIRDAFDKNGIRGVLDTHMNLDHPGLNAEDRAGLQWMHDMGGLNIGQSNQLMNMSQGKMGAKSDAARMLAMTAQYAEMGSRAVVFLAAHRLSRDNEWSRQTSVKGMDTFEPSQTSRMMGRNGLFGKVTPLSAEFMQYSAQTNEQIARAVLDGWKNRDLSDAGKQRSAEAKREFKYLMGTTMTLAGVMGLPFVTALSGIYNMLAKDEDDPSDIRADAQTGVAHVLGPELGAMLMHGPARAAGVDLSTTGMQDLFPGSEFLADRRLMKDRLESQSIALLGPALNAGIDIAAGASKISDGYYMKGIEEMLPSGLKGPYKAVELATKGYTDSKGNPIGIEQPTTGAIAWQALGFTPAIKAEQSEASRYYTADEQIRQHRKEVIGDQIFKAFSPGGTPEDQQEVLADMQRFNQANPADAFRDIGGVFREHAIKLALAKSTGTGIGFASGKQSTKAGKYGFSTAGRYQ